MPAKPYTGRDVHLVALINGATKAGVHKDQRREASRRACRRAVRRWRELVQAGDPPR